MELDKLSNDINQFQWILFHGSEDLGTNNNEQILWLNVKVRRERLAELLLMWRLSMREGRLQFDMISNLIEHNTRLGQCIFKFNDKIKTVYSDQINNYHFSYEFFDFLNS